MKLILVILFTLISVSSFAQKTLDIEKYKNCELFADKGDFDNSERLEQVKELEGELITVYLLKRGKKNIIKSTFTGKIDYTTINKKEKDNEEPSVEVIVIAKETEEGKMKAIFPHTNMKYYRLYKANCLNN
ncbi:hypothetical protein [Flammeovirga kamogawensis]|uniref:Uncharacterized protein n=1 Tax=Flammeovirga kamogawensis TaxID=373891 RepID=A0ABX8H2P9_9BACT|nr:hypothetical protein [Flammeovirga kamogawensis]MBB6464109.1 hypothetical protein [Flammeovirga kamogawensis]QWG09908.1 hypothetical protein KM029_19700 [Flammeovirga kamogawensis]TRX65412.1 hypothetical protein EO216_23095 [Flammeovirga kamogawensis]